MTRDEARRAGGARPPLRPGCAITDDGMLSIRSSAVANDMIVRLTQAGEGFRAPLLRAARDRKINLVMASPGQRIPEAVLHFRKPTLIVLADDQPAATGPDAWPQARKLLRWARSGLFHAAAGLPEHYALAVQGAEITSRMLVVEMEQRHHAAWLSLATRITPRLPILNIMPREGIHPTAGPPAGVVVQ